MAGHALESLRTYYFDGCIPPTQAFEYDGSGGAKGHCQVTLVIRSHLARVE